MKKEYEHEKKRDYKLTTQQKRNLKYILSAAVLIILVVIWFYTVTRGINIGRMYIDDAIANVEMRNVENHQDLTEQNIILNKEIEALNAEINNMRDEVSDLNDGIELFSLDVSALKSSIEFIDTNVTTSIAIQAEIGNKIQELDNRLKDLRNSLNILLEAPR